MAGHEQRSLPTATASILFLFLSSPLFIPLLINLFIMPMATSIERDHTRGSVVCTQLRLVHDHGGRGRCGRTHAR